MRKRNQVITYIVAGFFSIGLLVKFLEQPLKMIVPLVIFGVVFYLYKFPPSFARGGRRPAHHQPERPSAKRNVRKAKFRVIRGNKDNGEDDPPRYH